MGEVVEPGAGSDLPYLDGAEAYLAEVLAGAEDRSSGSDELAKAIVDWPTEYHLSCLRANLLRPLSLGPTTTVLDVGAGTGALSRYLGEVAGRVVALEGSSTRAALAGIRCADQPNVEVRHGTLDDLGADERFDVVLLIGVLEYSGAAIGGGEGAREMLRKAAAHRADEGVIVLAIENQLGLKYLLGAPEDHRGQPWVGIDDYPGPPGVRTWTRRELGALLDEAGLTERRWLLPFPDYKMPTVVLDEQAYRQADGAELIDQLVSHPVRVLDGQLSRLADAAAAHGVFLRGGLGLDVANSFLVLAGTSSGAVDRAARRDALAWLYGPTRRSRWRRSRVLTTARVLELLDDPAPRSDGWLVQDPGADRPYRVGKTLGQRARAAVRAHDAEALAVVLRHWADDLFVHAVPGDGSAGADGGPFAPRSPEDPRLPSSYLDASLDNFVVDGETLHFIDDEWRTAGPLSATLAYARSIWVLARDIVESGIEHPWGPDATVLEVTLDLAERAGRPLDDDVLHDWRRAEHELQALVAGASEEHLASTWTNGATAGIDLRVDQRRVRQIDALTRRVADLEATARSLEEQVQALTGQRQDLRDLGLRYQEEIKALEAKAAELRTLGGFVAARRR